MDRETSNQRNAAPEDNQVEPLGRLSHGGRDVTSLCVNQGLSILLYKSHQPSDSEGMWPGIYGLVCGC